MTRLREAEVAEKFREVNGNVSAAARQLGVTRQGLHKYLRTRPRLRAVLDEARQRLLDLAEEQLGRAVREGALWAVLFTLKTVGKSRGWGERPPHEPPEGWVPIKVIEYRLPSRGSDPAPAPPQLPAPSLAGPGQDREPGRSPLP
jgi:hypothetical protein